MRAIRLIILSASVLPAIATAQAPNRAIRTIQLGLDQNIYAANVARAAQVPEITDGMRVARMTLNGERVDLKPPMKRRCRFGAAAGRGLFRRD